MIEANISLSLVNGLPHGFYLLLSLLLLLSQRHHISASISLRIRISQVVLGQAQRFSAIQQLEAKIYSSFVFGLRTYSARDSVVRTAAAVAAPAQLFVVVAFGTAVRSLL
jgi:hypothetical protein